MSFSSWEIRDEILDAMAETLGRDPNIGEAQRKKFQAYAHVKKAERVAEKLIEDAKDTANKSVSTKVDAPTTTVDDTDDDGE